MTEYGEMKVSEEFTMTLSNGKIGKFECIEDQSDDTKRVMKFELMDNAELYNGVRFTREALQHQMNVFNDGNFLVTHGMDHSGDVLDQLGKVVRMEMTDDGEVATVSIISEHYKKTYAQQQAEILFEQGLLDSISGGWRCSIAYNEQTDEYEVYKPMLREVSSTPVPAKTDATALDNDAQTIQDMCMSLNHNPKMKKEEAEITETIPKEELDMTDEEQTQEVSQEAQEKTSAEFTALQEQVSANAIAFQEMKDSQEATIKASLIEKGVELGLSDEDFEGMSIEAMKASLKVANKVKMSTLRENDPDIALGDDGNAQELSEKAVVETFYDWEL